MPDYNIVTSVNSKYWTEGSKINVLTWDKYFPENCNIYVYHEDEIADKQIFSSRVKFYNLYNNSPELLEFINTHRTDPHYNGTKVTNSNAYKWNAIKFAHKTFAIFDLHTASSADYLVWLDADMLLHHSVTQEFLDKVCKENIAVTYLGRPSVHSECGFVAYNLKHKVGQDFLNEFKRVHIDDDLKNMRETHDSFVFDQVRIKFDQANFLNLNAEAITNKHPVTQSMLYEVMVHTKGKDKLRQQLKFIKRFQMKDIESKVKILYKLEMELKDDNR